MEGNGGSANLYIGIRDMQLPVSNFINKKGGYMDGRVNRAHFASEVASQQERCCRSEVW
jgi:hypothetical protein